MFRPVFFIFLSLSLPFLCLAQDPSLLQRQAARLEASFKEEEALEKYQEVVRLQPHNVMMLCRCSDLSCRIGHRQGSREKEESYYRSARTYAETAYRLDPKNSEASVVMAFSLARMALMEGPREKVEAARAIKSYAEKAIQLDPSNYKAYHILGRWNYEVSNLNSFERTLARWFYGRIPDGSLKEAIAFYEKSMQLKPGLLVNYLELAKACRRDGQNERALQLLKHIDVLADEIYDDQAVRQEAKKLLSRWQ
jgi:tetratricopeptide (TPR) repeat protein